MELPVPVLVTELFPEERTRLLDLLSKLSMQQWEAPTACAGWSVKDVAAHIIGTDMGVLSRHRDGYEPLSPYSGESLVTFIDRINDEWMHAARRLSAGVLCDLLRLTGEQLYAYYTSLDLFALGEPVQWAGPDPAPVWLDVAREYTEKWHHQKHIRDAIGEPGLTEPRFFAPVLSTFARSLPVALCEVAAPDGTIVQFSIVGESGGDWLVVREESRWVLYAGSDSDAVSRVMIDEGLVWRLFTKGLRKEQISSGARIEGDGCIAGALLNAVAIIA